MEPVTDESETAMSVWSLKSKWWPTGERTPWQAGILLAVQIPVLVVAVRRGDAVMAAFMAFGVGVNSGIVIDKHSR